MEEQFVDKSTSRHGRHSGKVSLIIIALLVAVSLAAVWLLPSSAENSVIEISTVQQFKEFRDKVNSSDNYAGKTVRLTADIDLGGTSSDKATWWTPIGTNRQDSFSGVFDGNGHKVTGLFVSSDKDYQGLFGCISGDAAEIKDLDVSGNISGGKYAIGGVLGYNLQGTVTNCVLSGTVRGSGYGAVGGVVGTNDTGTVTHCTSSCNVSGDRYVSGIVGLNGSDCKVINCLSSGTVRGTYCVGGVVGDNYQGNTVANCTSSCSVSGMNYVGGVVGASYNGCTVANCASYGNVNGTGDRVGGILGDNEPGGTVTNCASSGNVSGTGEYVGGVVGSNWNGSIITNCVSSGTVNGTVGSVGGVAGYNYCGKVSNCGWLRSGYKGEGVNGDTASVDQVVSFDKESMKNIAVTLIVGPQSITLAKGEEYNVSFATVPSDSADFAKHVTKVAFNVADKSVAKAETSGDKKIIVAGVGYGATKMTVSVNFRPTLFSGDLTETSGDIPVSADVMITVPGHETSSSGTSSCNAGFGALSLIAVPFVIRLRKRKIK